MKKIGLFLLVLVVSVACKNKSTIEVITENVADNTTVEVQSRELGEAMPKAILTGKIKDGKVTFDNTFADIDEGFIAIKDNEGLDATVFFVGEPGSITIKFDKNKPDDSVVGGTESNEQLQKFLNEIRPIVVKIKAFMAENEAKMMKLVETGDENSIELKNIKETYEKMSKEPDAIVNRFESENRGKAIGLLMLFDRIPTLEKTPEEYKAIFDSYPASLKTSKLGKKVEDRLKEASGEKVEDNKGLSVGDKLPEFKALSTEGKELTLTTFLEGKSLVLVDVWASWCGPCRQENPNLVKTYNAFHEKGFDIIGYSLDKDDTAWKKAIEKDKLTWTQVSNLKFWQDPIVGDYNITGVPANYLIDGNGTILAMNLRGEELDKKLEELLAK